MYVAFAVLGCHKPRSCENPPSPFDELPALIYLRSNNIVDIKTRRFPKDADEMR